MSPIMCACGILITFRVAGPAYNFQEHFKKIIRGEDPGPCRLRERDEFQELAGLINEAVDVLRAGQSETQSETHRKAS